MNDIKEILIGTVLFLVFVSIVASCNAEAKVGMSEDDHVKQTCEGKSNSRNSDGTYTDCLTSKYAIEYDWPHKWYECVGQALHYSVVTGKKPVCRLIITEREGEVKYVLRAMSVAKSICNRISIQAVLEGVVYEYKTKGIQKQTGSVYLTGRANLLHKQKSHGNGTIWCETL